MDELTRERRYAPRVVAWPGVDPHDTVCGTGATPEGVALMAPKAQGYAVVVEALRRPQAHILKETLLSLGGDAALHRDVIVDRVERAAVVLIGHRRIFQALPGHLAPQPFGLGALGRLVLKTIQRFERPPGVLRFPGRAPLDLSARTGIMAVLNVTPDSFSDGGEAATVEAAVEKGVRLAEAGADLLDIGGESTRPGAAPVSDAEQIARVVPVIERLVPRLAALGSDAGGVPISIDARQLPVVQAALDAGAQMVNDISGCPPASGLAALAAERGVPYIVMHMRGEPGTMQERPAYADVVAEVAEFLRDRALGLVAAGLARAQIVIDPGFGFGKTVAHNLELLRRLAEFRSLGMPVLAGLSRKSLFQTLTGAAVGDRVIESVAAHVLAAQAGARLVRVHDVREHRKALAVLDAYRRGLAVSPPPEG